jgi:sugar O-acyltransferase (sialic acid O-acetyltransferase NeuD family)
VHDAIYGVYGCSGFGREVMPLARESAARAGGACELVFVDDGGLAGQVVNGHRVLTYAQFLSAAQSTKYISIAIADAEVRERLASQCALDGVKSFEVRASNALVLDENHIGEGAILCGFSHVTSNARIGRHFHANIYSYVAHDCVVGDFVTLAPGAKINGNVVLEDYAYVGTGAIIKQGSPGKPTVVGRRSVIGMGAVVTRSVPADVVVVGNPARELQK